MPPQQNKPPDFIPAGPDFIPAEGQGSSPNYGPDVTVANPTMSQIGKGVLREGAQLLAGAHGLGKSAIEHIPGVKDSVFDRSMQQHQAELDQMATPENLGEAMGKTGGEMASYLLPAKLETGAVEMAPEALRPLARVGAGALSSGTMNRLNGGSFGQGAAIGGGMTGLGEIGKGFIAPAMMRSAIGGGIGKDTANALLEETKGIRPSTVLKNTSGRIAQASDDLDNAVANDPEKRLSMEAAKVPLMAAHDLAGRQRVPEDAAQLRGMIDFLEGTGEYGPERPAAMTPQEMLEARRGYGRNFISNRQWNQTANSPVMAAAKQGYGGLTNELHMKAPGSIEADQMMENLIPAKQALKAMVKRDPSVGVNVMGRMGARTGALTSAAMGAAGGARAGGLPGAILGGVTGLAVPEVLSAPTAKMALARGLYSTVPPKLGRAALQSLLNSMRTGTGGQAQ